MEPQKVYKLLLVDDDAQILLVLNKRLQAEPYKLLYTPKGQEALGIAIKEQPDLILLDWVMPDLDGIETLEVLKAHPEVRQIPVIMFTGLHKDAAHLEQALTQGAVDFLHKPFDPIVLKARVANTIRLHEANQALLAMEQRETERLQEEIDAKTRELASQAMHQHELESLLQDVQRLIETEEMGPAERKEISQRIRQQLANNSWEEFQRHFEAVNPQFFSKLTAMPGKPFTPAEVKYAAYLRIGLRNTDIANLLGISNDSLNTSLYRMKKKVNLTGKDSLREFIQQL
ncbi:MAG: response regulator [Bacteroidota bacterium]